VRLSDVKFQLRLEFFNFFLISYLEIISVCLDLVSSCFAGKHIRELTELMKCVYFLIPVNTLKYLDTRLPHLNQSFGYSVSVTNNSFSHFYSVYISSFIFFFRILAPYPSLLWIDVEFYLAINTQIN